MNTAALHIIRFVALLLAQVLVLDHLDVANGYAVPYLYILFLLLLPFELPAWAVLLISAATGMSMDLFSDTPGMHMSACVLLGFARIHLLRMIAPREGYEYGMRPTLLRMGVTWWITYAGVLILVHHLWLFNVELLRWERFGETFLRSLLSAAFTLLLCMLAQFLTARPERGRA